MVTGFIIQITDGQRCTLAVIILLGILYLIGEFYRRNRLIGQFILNVCIILCLLVCISRSIPIIICVSGSILRSLVVVSSVCTRRIVCVICGIINGILGIAVLGRSMNLEIRCAHSDSIIATAVFRQLRCHTQVNCLARLDLIIRLCALAQFCHQTLVCSFLRICIRCGEQCILDSLFRLNCCAAI